MPTPIPPKGVRALTRLPTTFQEGTLWDDDHDNVGIPADSGVGMSVSGQVLYPIWNNVAVYTPQQCEVDSCNEHVGQGGGQPHLHGDPYGDEAPTKCLYGPSNYTGAQYVVIQFYLKFSVRPLLPPIGRLNISLP